MRQYVKSDSVAEEIADLSDASFVDLERAPRGMLCDIYDRGIVFTTRGMTVGSVLPPLMGAALVTTDDARFNEPYIWMIATAEWARGKGVARSLLEEIACFAQEEGFRGVSLMVNANNVDAIRLYLKEGYRVKRFHPAYYRTGGDGLYMRRAI